jgi:hypothetical protein
VEAAAPAAWAAEQSSRWAQTKGEAAQPSPASELQQRLDDSHKLFGSKRSSKQQQQGQGKPKKSAKGAPAGAGAGAGTGAASPKQQAAGASSGSRILPRLDPAATLAGRDIPVSFQNNSSSRKQPSSSDAAAAPAPAGAAAAAGPAKEAQAQPSKEAQRSAAEAADALAALMAEIEGEAVAESDQEEVLRELGLTDEDSTEAQAAQAAELQEAAELVQQATKQLDDLQAQEAASKVQSGKSADGAAAAGAQQQAGASGKGHRQQHKHEQRKQSSQGGKQQQQPASGSSAGAASSSTGPAAKQRQKKKPGRALGSSGDAAFLAAAKALDGSKAPSRTLLLGCLEAIEQQQQQLRAQLAKQQVESAVAGAAQRQQAAQDPSARKLAQLRADFDRARERAAQEKSSIRETAAADVLGRLLPLLDSFEAAEAALDKQQQAAGAAGSEREYEEARRVYNALHAQLLSIIK